MAIKNVVLVGANGNLGPAVLKRLLSAGTFNVTVLTRSSSKSTYGPNVQVAHISDSFPVDELVKVLRGQDAVVVTVHGTLSDVQLRLADAAKEAGVKRFIPADFGSCDSTSERALSLLPIFVEKQKVRRHLMQLASGESGMSWTSLVNGHFFDWGLKVGFMHYDFKAMKAEILDDGKRKWSATTLDTIGLGVVRVLQKEEETKNKILYIESFLVSQNEVLEKLKFITGKNWQVEHFDSDQFIKDHKAALEENGDKKAIEEIVFALGLVEGNWEEKENFANELLGLEKEDLEQVLRRSIA